MSLSGFAAGFAAGWSMVDDFMGKLEERKEKQAGEQGLADAQSNSVAAMGQRFAAAQAGDGTTPETAIPPERIEQDDAAEGSWLSGRRASGDLPDVSEVENYIRQTAQRFGIEPDAAVAAARTEGLAPGVWQSRVARTGRGSEGGQEASFGPFQLYMGGGLGNEFQKATGLDPRDPSTWKQQVDFSLEHAARIGQWYDPTPGSKAGPWFGPRDKGLPHNYGMPQRQSAIPMDDEAPMQYGMQPTFMANAGGAIPDGQGQTTFTSQSPNAQGSVFLQHETQRPQQQQQAARIQFPQQQARQAIPTGPSTGDRFREMRAGHAQRRADAEAARAAAAAQQPVQNKSTYTDDEWDSRMWMHEQQRQGGGRQMQSAGDYGAPNQLQSLMQIHRDHGGLRSDPSGAYIVKPPQQDGWIIQSGPQWEEYKKLPKAPKEMVDTAFSRWRFNTTGANMYGDPGGGVANASHGGNPSLGHGTSTDW
jgi:hypothetical protein